MVLRGENRDETARAYHGSNANIVVIFADTCDTNVVIVLTKIHDPQGQSLSLPLRGERIQGYHSSAEALTVDSVFSNFVTDDTFGGMQQLRSLSPITTRGLQGILNQVTFKGLNRIRQ